MNKTSYEKLKKEVAEQHNVLRKNPKSYMAILEKYIKYFKGNVIYKPGSDCGIETVEGKSAYEECIEFLKKQKALGELTHDTELSKASQDHANDIGPSGSCDHAGSDGSNMDTRVSRYLEWDVSICENIDFGAPTAEEIIISLIVDDGVKNRGHRVNMFKTDIKYIGVGIANHSEYGICTVIDYVGGISSYKKGGKVNTTNSTTNNKVNTTNNNSITTTSGGKKYKDHFKSVKNTDEENEKLKVLREAIISRDKSNTVNKGNDLSKDFNNKLIIGGGKKATKISDDPFKDDPDAPEGAIACSVKTTTKKVGNKTTKTTVKTYTLSDDTQEILEITETEG